MATKEKLPNHVATAHSQTTIEKMKRVPIGGKLSDVEQIYGSTYRRLDPNRPSYTVTRSGYRDFIHPYADRMLTVRELACLQTFPLDWEFKGVRLDSYSHARGVPMTQFGQVGNAVPPLLAEAVARSVREQWFSSEEE